MPVSLLKSICCCMSIVPALFGTVSYLSTKGFSSGRGRECSEQWPENEPSMDGSHAGVNKLYTTSPPCFFISFHVLGSTIRHTMESILIRSYTAAIWITIKMGDIATTMPSCLIALRLLNLPLLLFQCFSYGMLRSLHNSFMRFGCDLFPLGKLIKILSK